MVIPVDKFCLMTVAVAVALAMSGCGGGGGDREAMPMPDYMPLDGWDIIRSDSLGPVGVEHEEYGLRVWYDGNFHISPSAPQHQPTIAGRWEGEWAGYIGDEFHDGAARVDVTLGLSTPHATLTYDGVPGYGSLSSDMMPVTNGAFQGTKTVPGVDGTFSIRGQFGGSDQAGVAGYVDGPESLTVFHGERTGR